MTNPNNPVATEDTINLKELFFYLLYQWHIIVLCVLLSLIVAILYLKVTAPTYSVDAKIQMIDNKPSGLAGLSPQLASLGSLAGINLGGGAQSIQTEIEILQSRSILGKTIHDLNLDIVIQPKQSLWQKITTTQRSRTDYDNQKVIISDKDSQFNIQQFEVPKNLLDQGLSLTFHDQSFIITSDKTGLEVFKGLLNQSNTATGWKVFIGSKSALQGEYQIQKQSIPSAIKALLINLKAAELSKQTGIINVSYDGTDKQHIIKVLNHILNTYQTQSLSTKSNEKEKSLAFLNEQLPKLKQELEQAEKQFNTFRKQHGTVDVQQESTLYLKQSTELETQKIQLEQKQAQLSAQYTAQHPVMQEIGAQINALNNKINQLNSTLKSLPNLQSEYLQYYRDVQIKTQLYTNLLGSYQSLSLAKAGDTDSTRILDYPVEPNKPIKPKKLIILILSIFLGGFIGVLIALTRMIVQSGLRNREEIKELTNLTTYVELPQYNTSFRSKRKIVSHRFANLDAFTPTLMFKLADKINPAILLSSISPNIQQSNIAKYFALSLAQANKRVMLIDSDLQRGAIAQSFSLPAQPGLIEYLIGQTTLEKITHSVDQSQLTVIPRGQTPADSSLLLNSEKFHQFIRQVQSQYDYVILSTAPILATPDSLILAKYTDFNLVLVQSGQTQGQDLVSAQSRFQETGLQIDGVILHDIPTYQRTSYDYEYQTSK